jgi:hypothetical protein
MNNVMPIRSGCVPPQTGWVWTGQQWIWCGPHPEHPIWPPQQPCPPQPCPPSGMVPPSCFDQIAKASACWDQSTALYDFLTKVITDIFTNDPSIIPPPPPSAGTGPIIGVTDGSVAAPGEVGEVLRSTVNGSVTSGGGFSATFQALSLTPGDWDVDGDLFLSDVSSQAQYWSVIQYSLTVGGASEAAAQINAIWAGGVGGFAGGDFLTNPFAISVSQPTLVVGQISLGAAASETVPGTYIATTAARRRR